MTTTKPCQNSQPRDVSAGNKISPDTSNVPAWACLCRMLPRTRFLAHGAPRQLAAAQATWVNRFAYAVYIGTRLSQGKTADGLAAAYIASAAERKPKLGCWLLSPTVDDTSAHTVGCGIFRDCRMTFAFSQLCCGALQHECWITFALFREHRSASSTIREVSREWNDGILTPFRLYVWVAQYCA